MTPQFSRGVSRSGSFISHRQQVSPERIEAAFGSMNGWEKRSIKFTARDKVRLRFSCQLLAGELSIELTGPDGRMLIHWGDKPSSVDDFTAPASGKYEIRTTGNRASGSYKLEMDPNGYQQT